MKLNRNEIALLTVLFAEVMMSSSALARDISPGEPRLADDRWTAVCHYLAIEQNPVGLKTLELREAQDRLDDAMAVLPLVRERLAKEQEILDLIRPVFERGAISELQLNRQEQQVLSVQNEVLTLELEIFSSLERMESARETIARQATRAKLATLMETSGWCQE
ncbi:MAG TPA: hypothetical protein IGS17_11025 [Oscillatoriales cyanobacterium M59_W2019_021]|nr:MAG: hypothetical protein D6728_21195 [Cyanobacteria bacterium J055]HIK33924.1 hypothetical protein [Oscillatoriales cyanobacterium M4454_W2019_049]HIK51439.1 hypothetical protein [Oscillatoriales cyanobacterium M59_W2019_021]